MRANPYQLQSRLKQGLAPVYFVYGDEPLLADESCQAIRKAALEQGYDERVRLNVESGFDWGSLLAEANALSLFSSRKLIELSMPGGKPGAEGSAVLAAYAQTPPQDSILLIQSGRLDAATRRRKWFTALDKAGVTVQTTTPDARQFPEWVQQRLQKYGLSADRDAVSALAATNEGNLLACDQEIRKLALLHPDGQLTLDRLRESLADNARYNLFSFVDICLSGKIIKAVRMLRGMRAQGEEAILVVWALTREVRTLTRISAELAKGQPEGLLFKQNGVWQSRIPAVRSALQRSTPADWRQRHREVARLDRIVKGAEPGNIWREIEIFIARLAGAGTRMTSLENV